MKHLLYLRDLNKNLIDELLESAEYFLSKKNNVSMTEQILQGIDLANIFFEPSTRTRSSFQIAARKLGSNVLNIDEEHSSRTKGETIIDTIKTLEAMGVTYFIIRHKEQGFLETVLEKIGEDSHLINAGESSVSHPTQGLLDLLTIKRHKSNFQDIKVTIVGDIKHSRVARSLVEGLTIMGTGQISLVSPNEFKPDMSHYQNADHTDDLAIGLKQADAVVALRVQKERIQELNNDIDSGHYFEAYGLTDEKIANCNDKVIVMHPGPMNRGIEISNEVADGPHSVINEQVTNGIAMRMALLSLIQSRHSSS